MYNLRIVEIYFEMKKFKIKLNVMFNTSLGMKIGNENCLKNQDETLLKLKVNSFEILNQIEFGRNSKMNLVSNVEITF